jgi:GrpB-like predicted nucleotidyltransferase (UPF0157 family)
MDEIELTGYDPRWPAEFQAEEARIRAVLPPQLILEVEHSAALRFLGLPPNQSSIFWSQFRR